MRILTTYGRHSKTLSVVRSLGRSGREVLVTDCMRWPISSFSKYCSGFVLTASPATDPDKFVQCLSELTKSMHIDLVMPMDDPECDILSVRENTSRIESQVTLPDRGNYEIARDKEKTRRFAEELGVMTPRSFLVRESGEALLIPREIGFPAIVKPVRSSGSRGFLIIKNEGMIQTVPKLVEKYGPLLAQEYIPQGGSIGVSYLLNHGEMRACFTHRRIIEYPETGGPSIVRESTTNPEAERAGRLLLEGLGWHGVAMAEFRIDPRNGKPILMEINPRFWGSLPLAIACGVDFPKLLCEMYEKGDVETVDRYRLGVRCVNFLPLGLASVFGANGLGRGLRITRHALACKSFDIESLDDPIPMFGAVLALARFAMDRQKMETFFRISR